MDAKVTAPTSTDRIRIADILCSPPPTPSPPKVVEPNSDRIIHCKPSLLDLPAEIRLEIANELLTANQIPASYGYTGPLRLTRQPEFRKHGMILANKELSAEYRQVFYERTKFFLRVDAQNVFFGAPELAATTTPPFEQALSTPIHTNGDTSADPSHPRTETESAEYGGGVRNFWNAPPGLLRSLRHCTLYVELGEIAGCGRAAHSLSQVKRSDANVVEAHRVRREMIANYRSFSELKAADAVFDNMMKNCVKETLRQMEQLRSVQLVLETTVGRRVGVRATANWNWENLGAEIVEELKGRRRLERMQVKIGDCRGEFMYSAYRENGQWIGSLLS